MTNSIFASIGTALQPTFEALLAAAVVYLARVIRAHFKNTHVANSMIALTTIAEGAVADAEKKVVADLKTQPGKWTDVAAAAVKASVMADVKTIGSQAIATLSTTAIKSPADMDKLLSGMVEKAVAETPPPPVVTVATAPGPATTPYRTAGDNGPVSQ